MDARIISSISIALLSIGACTSGPTVSHTEPHGIVVLATAQTSHNNFPVQIREIDGVPVLAGRATLVGGGRILGGGAITADADVQNAYWLAPGRHTLRLTVILTDGRPLLREVRETRAEQAAHVLVLDVEEGKRYVIAAHRTGQRGSDWEPVVLEVQDIH